MRSHSSDSSEWDSDVSIGNLFKELSVNMISVKHPQEDQTKNMPLLETEPWAQQLDYQWEMHFEQREPPTEDEVIQIELGDEKQSKPIFISKSLSPTERQDLN